MGKERNRRNPGWQRVHEFVPFKSGSVLAAPANGTEAREENEERYLRRRTATSAKGLFYWDFLSIYPLHFSTTFSETSATLRSALLKRLLFLFSAGGA